MGCGASSATQPDSQPPQNQRHGHCAGYHQGAFRNENGRVRDAVLAAGATARQPRDHHVREVCSLAPTLFRVRSMVAFVVGDTALFSLAQGMQHPQAHPTPPRRRVLRKWCRSGVHRVDCQRADILLSLRSRSGWLASRTRCMQICLIKSSIARAVDYLSVCILKK